MILTPWRRRAAGFACAALVQAVNAGDATPEFTFTYAPKPGTHFVQTYLLTRERLIDGQPTQHDWAESKTDVRIDKSGDDYEVVTKPLSTVMKRDEEVIDDPVSAVLSEIAPAYLVGADGQIKDVRGFAGISEKLAAALPPAVVQALASLISEAAMVEREKADWRGRFGDFAGKRFKIGESIEATLPYKLPNGESVEHEVQTYFTRWESCPAGSCVRIDISYESALDKTDAPGAAPPEAAAAPAAAPASAPAAEDAPADEAKPPPLDIPKRRVSGSVSRLIDPLTMLIYAEEQSKTLTMPLDVADRGKQMAVFKETSRYEFRYDE